MPAKKTPQPLKAKKKPAAKSSKATKPKPKTKAPRTAKATRKAKPKRVAKPKRAPLPAPPIPALPLPVVAYDEIEPSLPIDRVYVEIDRSVREKLRIISAARGMRLFDLLNAIGRREVRAWEHLEKVNIGALISKRKKGRGRS